MASAKWRLFRLGLNELRAHYLISCKIEEIIIQPGHNFTHAMAVIAIKKMMQKHFWQEFSYELLNHLWNRSLVTSFARFHQATCRYDINSVTMA